MRTKLEYIAKKERAKQATKTQKLLFNLIITLLKLQQLVSLNNHKLLQKTLNFCNCQ